MNLKSFYDTLDRKYLEEGQESVYHYLQSTIDQHKTGTNQPLFIAANNELGSFFRGAGRYQESVQAFETAGSLIKDLAGESSIEYATNRNNIAGTYRLMGQYEKALELFSYVKSRYATLAGRNHYYYASALNNMALVYIQQKEYANAADCLKEALAIIRKMPERQEEAAITLVNLYAVEKKEEYLKDALDIYEHLENKGVHYSAALDMMGVHYYEQGNYADAEQCFRKAMAEVYQYYGESEEYRKASKNLQMAIDKQRGAKL